MPETPRENNKKTQDNNGASFRASKRRLVARTWQWLQLVCLGVIGGCQGLGFRVLGSLGGLGAKGSLGWLESLGFKA